MLSMKEMERKTELTSHTLRYYEKEGIISPQRLESGYRVFQDEDVEWMLFVKQLRDADIPIEEIKKYATLFHQGEAGVAPRLELMQHYVEETKQKIKKLNEIEKVMVKRIQQDKKIAKMINKQKRSI